MVLLAGRHAYPLNPTITATTTIKTKQQQKKHKHKYYIIKKGWVQCCALKVLEHPWCLTFALWWLGNLSIFMKIICQTPWISQFESHRIPLLFCKAQPWIAIINITKLQKQVQGHTVFRALFDRLIARENFACMYFQTFLGRKSTEANYLCQQLSKCKWK